MALSDYTQVDNGMGGFDYYDSGGNKVMNPNLATATAAASNSPTITPFGNNSGANGLWDSWNNGANYQSGIPSDLLGALNQGLRMRAGDESIANPGQFIKNSDGTWLYHPQGAGNGDTQYTFDNNGKFLNTYTAGHDWLNPLTGVLGVFGAGLGMAALGAGVGAAAGTGAGTATGAGLAGDATAAGYGGLDAASASTLGGGATVNGGAALGTAAAGTGAATGGLSLSQLLNTPGLSTGVKAALSGLLGSGGGSNGGSTSGGGNMDLSSLVPLLSGLNDAYQKNNASQNYLNWAQGQQNQINSLYQPGSPEYNALWDQMSRNDAAAGRNSQYGPRSVDLAARIAQIKADATTRLTTGLSNGYANAFNQQGNARSLPGVTSALGANSLTGSGLNSLINSLLNGSTSNLNFGGSNQTSYGPAFTDYASNNDIQNMINGFNVNDWYE